MGFYLLSSDLYAYLRSRYASEGPEENWMMSNFLLYANVTKVRTQTSLYFL